MHNDIWSKTLEYYLDSEHYYKSEILSFFYQYNYYGYCTLEENVNKDFDINCGNSKILLYESDVFQKFNKLSEQFIIDDIQRKQLACSYLSKNLCKEQLAAVIFAIWQGLPKNMVSMIADKRRYKITLDILNGFLCGESIIQMKSLLSKKKSIVNIHLKNYFLCIENHIQISKRKYVSAEYTDDGSLVDTNGKRYKILP